MEFVIEFKDVTFEYPEATFKLENISFQIEAGKKYALCGKNGAGKTTLIRLLMGLESAKKGTIIIDKIPVSRRTLKLVRQKIGFVFQNPDSQVFSASVYEDVAFGPRNMALTDDEVDKRVREALANVEMLEYIDRSPYQLSHGQKKRVAIAGILAIKPSIIVLDEPFSNLDYPSRKSLKTLLEKEVVSEGITIIFATHARKLIHDWADIAIFLEDGKVNFIGEPAGLLENPLAEKFLGPV